jgi:hypothetical protein
MKFEIKNQELKKLDEKLSEFNKSYRMIMHSLDSLPNIEAIKQIIQELKSFQKQIKEIKTNDEFEKLVIENILENLECQRVYLDYFSTRSKENIDQMIKSLLGEKALEILKQKVKDFDYKSYWEYYLSYQDYTYKAIPSDDENIRQELKKILEQLKKDILIYGEKHFNLPKTYDFDLILGQPYSDRSFFNPTIRRMEIAQGQFFIFKDKDKIKINVASVIETIFHELLGHGRHEFNSREMPLTLRDDSINISIACLAVHAEGVSQITRTEAIKFMKEYSKKYSIELDYIKQRELAATEYDSGNFWAYYQYLMLKQIENPEINLEKEFTKLTENYGLFLIYKYAKNSPFSFVRNSAYSIGLFYMNELFKNLDKEFGKGFCVQNESLVNEAISTGLWNFRVFPKFVKFFLKSSRS